MARNFSRKLWTIEEEQLLKSMYINQGMGWVEIAPILMRSVTSVHIKTKRMGLQHNKDQTRSLKSRLTLGEKNPMFGRNGPNKGLTKQNSERIRIASKKISKTRKEMFANGTLKPMIGEKNPAFGKKPWSYGLTKETSKKIRISAKKTSNTQRKQWKRLSEEKKEHRRVVWASQVLKKKHLRSSKEIIVENILNEIGVYFKPSYQISRFIFDFWIPNKNVCVECYGDYWHCNPHIYDKANKYQQENIDRDIKKLELLHSKSYEILILWEYDIVHHLDKVRNILIDKFK